VSCSSGSYIKDYQQRLPKTTGVARPAAAAADISAAASSVSTSPKNTMFTNLTGMLGMHRPWVIGLEHDWAVLLPALAIVPLFFLLHAALFNAHGGWSFGSRMWLDVLPACVWLLVPVVQYILATAVPTGTVTDTTKASSKPRALPSYHYQARTTAIRAMDGEQAAGSRPVAHGLVAVLVLSVGLSLAIQSIGLLAYTPQTWNIRSCIEVRCDLAKISPEQYAANVAQQVADSGAITLTPFSSSANNPKAKTFSRWYRVDTQANATADKHALPIRPIDGCRIAHSVCDVVQVHPLARLCERVREREKVKGRERERK